MASLYHKTKIDVTTKDLIIRPIEDGEYIIALTFPDEEDDDDVITEVLLTRDEVQECYDNVFNR